MKFLESINEYWEVVVFIALLIVSTIIYSIATRNRGSFVDTPDWSKVVRRIIEISAVFISFILLAFFVWEYGWLHKILAIFFPIGGLLSFFVTRGIVNWIVIRKFKNSENDEEKRLSMQQFKDNLADHLINALILTVFFLLGLLVILITVFKVTEKLTLYHNLTLVLDFFLSIQFSFLLYQLYYLIVVNNVPSEEIIQIIRICRDLNE